MDVQSSNPLSGYRKLGLTDIIHRECRKNLLFDSLMLGHCMGCMTHGGTIEAATPVVVKFCEM